MIEVNNPDYVKELFQNADTVKEARKLYPITENCIYIDSAHYSPYSLETNRRLREYIDKFTYTNDNLSLFNYRISDILKKKCARLINAGRDEIIITGSTTHGLNIFANGIALNRGDCVAYADSEFPAVVYPWLNQEKLRGFKNALIPSDNGKIKLEDIERVIKENNVKVLTISSVEFLGFRNDLDAISEICRSTGCYFVVDAIQSIGACPLDVQETRMDFLAAGSQKWMMAPAGIGFAYIPKHMRDKVHPTYVSTMSFKYDFKNFLNYKFDLMEDGCAYENSTLNTLGMIGLESSVDLFLKLGVENIFKHILYLQDIFIEELKDTDYTIESSLEPVNRSNILIFSHADKTQNPAIEKELAKKNIFIALREGYLRISPHLFNNQDDIYTLTKELKKL